MKLSHLPHTLKTPHLSPPHLPRPIANFSKPIPGPWLQKPAKDPYNPYDAERSSRPSIIAVLRHLRCRDWYILALGLPIVLIAVFYAVLLNFPNGALDYLEDPTFKGIVTIDELPKRLAGSPETENAPATSSPAAILINPSFERIQKVVEDMAATNSNSAHLAFVTFTNNHAYPNFQRGDYIDVRVTAPVAKAMAENLQSDATTSQDSTQTFAFTFPAKSFGYLTLSARANLQSLFWRTDLNLEQVTTFMTVLAFVLAAAFILWCRHAYSEAACEANWEMIIRGGSKSIQDLLDEF